MELISAISSTSLGLLVISVAYMSNIPSTDVVEFFPGEVSNDDTVNTISNPDFEPLQVISQGGSLKEPLDLISSSNSDGGKPSSINAGGFGLGSSSDFSFGSSFGISGGGGSGGGSRGGTPSGGSSGGGSSEEGSSGGEIGEGDSGGDNNGEIPDETSPDLPPVIEQNSSIALFAVAKPVMVPSGETVSFTYDVTNNGDSDLNCGPIMDETLGEISAGNVGTLEPGASLQFSSSVNIYENTQTASKIICLDPENDPVVDTAMVHVTVLVVGGNYMQIKSAALLYAGLEANVSWIIPIVGSIVAFGIVLFRKTL